MSRVAYIMKEKEIMALVVGFIKCGPEDTYIKMKTKALFVMDKVDDLDEEFLDRSIILLSKARQEQDEDNDDSEEISHKDIYYTLSFMLRKLAHEINREYIKRGKTRNSNRFLRLVSNNKEAPLLLL